MWVRGAASARTGERPAKREKDAMTERDACAGVDVGKGFHHLYALGPGDEVLADRRVGQDEAEIEAALRALRMAGSVLVVVDQNRNIGSLVLSCARAAGCGAAWLPGRSMRLAAGMLPGEAKTDSRDARAMAWAAKALPQALRPVRAPDPLRAGLAVLASLDSDLRADAVRGSNRLRAVLLEVHPAFERALGRSVTSAYALSMLAEFGGPWGMRDAGREAVGAWLRDRGHRPPGASLDRLFAAIGEMSRRPDGADAAEAVAIPSHARRLLATVAERSAVEGRMRAAMAGDPVCEALLTMPGVGVRTACALVCHVDPDMFDSADALCSYAGLAPVTWQSGTSIKGERASRGGNKALKGALRQSALAAIRVDPRSRGRYDRKRSEGKGHRAALIGLARKRLKVMFAMMRSREPYRAA